MEALLQQLSDWLKGMLVDGIMNNLSGMFDAVNQQVADVATQVGNSPANFSPEVFGLVRNISETVIIPIAGMFLTFIACYELIQLIIEHNNLANFETWIFFKWIFKTFVAVMLITNTFNIVMAVFDVAQHVVNASAGLISGSTAVDASPWIPSGTRWRPWRSDRSWDFSCRASSCRSALRFCRLRSSSSSMAE